MAEGGGNFVILRREKRKADRGIFLAMGHGAMSSRQAIGSVPPSSSSATEFNEAVNNTLNLILRYMPSHQSGDERIFTAPPQNERTKLIQLHQKYKAALNLKNLAEDGFSQTKKVCRFHIEQYSSDITNIVIVFWQEGEEKPFYNLPITLRDRTTRFDLIIKAPVSRVNVETDSLGGTRVRWSLLIEKRQPDSVTKYFLITMRKYSGKHRLHNTWISRCAPASDDSDPSRQSPTTTAFTPLTKTIYEISEMLLSATIYALFRRLYDSNVHDRAIDLLRKATFPEFPSTTLM